MHSTVEGMHSAERVITFVMQTSGPGVSAADFGELSDNKVESQSQINSLDVIRAGYDHLAEVLCKLMQSLC